MSAEEEARLIGLARVGDFAAFGRLVDMHQAAVRAFLRRVTGNYADADDLAQEAFLRVHRSFERFRDGEPFAPWFFKILRNACLNFLERHKHRRRQASLDARRDEDDRGWEIADPGALAPVDQAQLSEAQRAFWTSLEHLSDAHREIVLLRHVQDLEYSEIATILDIPIGTVMSRLFHARRRLRGFLEAHCDFEITPGVLP